MKLDVIYSKNIEDMENKMNKLESFGFNEKSSEDNFILARKREYGNIYIHIIIFIIALLFFWIFIILSPIYFIYNIFKKSRYVLITTEKKDKEGNDLEFIDIEEFLREKE